MLGRSGHAGTHGWLRMALIDTRAHKNSHPGCRVFPKMINKTFICAMLGPFAHVANYLSSMAADFT
jgi:hypothetical protein